ncbi:hypothetical protein niasHT_031229 [Heterodera trifolii]|uniref:Serine-threonine/tyrosine-protein kinase catalytic domain-containing protein n=1 Tax=Heterodera trifolii TaxID=157864 RepID=A0ABD2I9U6_9BILA
MTREHVMLVFELASDGSLLHFLKTYQRPTDVKWTMCVDTASGLAYIHEMGIVHCSWPRAIAWCPTEWSRYQTSACPTKP